MESLYELWGKRNPEWEERYQDSPDFVTQKTLIL